jgi:hypothetical protein
MHIVSIYEGKEVIKNFQARRNGHTAMLRKLLEDLIGIFQAFFELPSFVLGQEIFEQSSLL